MIKKLLFLSSISLGMQAGDWWERYDLKRCAVVRKPVADMVAGKSSRYQNFVELYEKIPFSCQPDGFPCVRMHQCLYNEVIFEAHLSKDECIGTIPDAAYAFDNKGCLRINYSTLASNVIALSDLKSFGIDLNSIPAPFILGRNQQTNTLTLVMPWRDDVTGLTYSAGTRFARIPSCDTSNEHAVMLVDYQLMKVKTAKINRKLVIIDRKKSAKKLRAELLQVLNKWVTLDGEIPYVIGGSSFTEIFKPGFSCFDEYRGKSIYRRDGEPRVKSGFDCSELIWRATHMVGIPYYYKNSAMVDRFLVPLAKRQRILPGDIIWMPGHVVVVDDLKRNTIIEAAGYTSGYGKVLKIQLFKRFEHISSYQDLVSAYHKKQPLIRIEKNGEKKRYKHFKIFKLFKNEAL